MPPKRPNAWDVSFPDEAAGASVALTPSQAQAPRDAPSGHGGRRKNSKNAARGSAEQTPPASKRTKVAQSEDRRKTLPGPKRAYVPAPKDFREDANTVVWGEDAVEESSADTLKPIRALSDFVVFDPTRNFELISLAVLDDSAAPGRHFEAAGQVRATFLNQEDEGQEDDLDDDDSVNEGRKAQRLRTSAIFRWTLDYTKPDDPIYIETQFSWFELRAPADLYSSIHKTFYRPHRIAQIVICAAMQSPDLTLDEFAEDNYGVWDEMLHDVLCLEDMQAAIPVVQSVLEGLTPDQRQLVLKAQFLGDLIRRQPTPYPSISIPRSRVAPPRRIDLTSVTGKLDLSVLRPENQNATHVSALIDTLALGLFHEHLKVVGPPPKRPTKHALKREQGAMRLALMKLANRCIDEHTTLDFPANRRLHDQYWGAVLVDGVTYEIGDCIVVQANSYRDRPPSQLPNDLAEFPDTASIADYFWFAKIVHLDQRRKSLHVRWFEHSSKTFLNEISDPHELFLWSTCDDVDAEIVVGKAIVHPSPPADRDLEPLEYFCRFAYDESDGSFQDIDNKAGCPLQAVQPPENCATCLRQEQLKEDAACTTTKGVLFYGGHTYHKDEYAIYASAGGGPAHIGRITRIYAPAAARASGSAKVRVFPLHRRSDVLNSSVGFDPLKMVHERELVATADTRTIELDAKVLLRPCLVSHPRDSPDLQAWLDLSPFHFYLKYQLPTLTSPWSERKKLRRSDIPVCDACVVQHNTRNKLLLEFNSGALVNLRAFDPFGGVGAFALAMEELGCLKLTHAVEITPSAALTLRENSPGTVVFNQCSNLVFQHAVKCHAGNLSSSDTLHNHDGSPVGRPPGPGDIDCIVAGFPCQPHSQLNMYKKANDRKTNLILNLLSWVDFLRPKYCFFENVRGFLSSTLHARQASKYRVEGGIKMGGLKFLTRALLAMGYQVRFGLLQAAHYGTPQSRVRFFLIAAQQGHPLPKLPQPTHYFPVQDSLEIKFSPDLPPIHPILTTNGAAPFKFVSIMDAIGDLPRFDWKDPQKILPPTRASRSWEGVLTLDCDVQHQPCGVSGPCPSETLSYRYKKPRNSFQAKCRRRPRHDLPHTPRDLPHVTRDLQHITRVLPLATVERVVNIPLRPGADYHDLDPRLWEWQSAHPTSAMARDGYRPGMYGRLDGDKWFHTTVTNVSPTAKQSRVIHPEDKRVLTVRELARSQGFPDWFTFHAVDGNVKTLQRHIGNAVPWPVSVALARELREALVQEWLQKHEDAIRIDSDSE